MRTTGVITQSTHVSWMVTHDESRNVLRTNLEFNVMLPLLLQRAFCRELSSNLVSEATTVCFIIIINYNLKSAYKYHF